MNAKRNGSGETLFALERVKAGERDDKVCRQPGVSQAAFCQWKKNYAPTGAGGLKRLKQLQDENARLKELAANLFLGEQNIRESEASYVWAPPPGS